MKLMRVIAQATAPSRPHICLVGRRHGHLGQLRQGATASGWARRPAVAARQMISTAARCVLSASRSPCLSLTLPSCGGPVDGRPRCTRVQLLPVQTHACMCPFTPVQYAALPPTAPAPPRRPPWPPPPHPLLHVLPSQVALFKLPHQRVVGCPEEARAPGVVEGVGGAQRIVRGQLRDERTFRRGLRGRAAPRAGSRGVRAAGQACPGGRWGAGSSAAAEGAQGAGLPPCRLGPAV